MNSSVFIFARYLRFRRNSIADDRLGGSVSLCIPRAYRDPIADDQLR